MAGYGTALLEYIKDWEKVVAAAYTPSVARSDNTFKQHTMFNRLQLAALTIAALLSSGEPL